MTFSEPMLTDAGFALQAPGNTTRPTMPVSTITEKGAEFPTRICTIPFWPLVPGVFTVRMGTLTLTGVVTAREG